MLEIAASPDSGTHAGVAATSRMHVLFEQQAGRTPDATALIFAGSQTSYRALNASANRLARHLRDHGVGADTPVGLCIDRSPEMVVAILAILKAGGCYVPLDPTHPPRRIALLARKAGFRVLLTTRSRLGLWTGFGEATTVLQFICIDLVGPIVAHRPDDDLQLVTGSDDLAYLLFTSGSTGTPKAVAMPHRALVNLLGWQQRQRPAGPGERTLQFHSLTFDVATQEIFASLCFGGTLVLVPDHVRRDPQALLEFVTAHAINRAFLPVVALEQLAQAAHGGRPAALRAIFTAGEQLQITPSIVRFFRDGGCMLQNQYGPTETHVLTAYTLPQDVSRWPRLPPIGRPVSNVEIHLLDQRMCEVAPGEAGELFVGGVCLARGYHGEGELTAQRFVSNPFGQGRLYRTGDLARHLPDGNLQFLGRLDDQVKIRGNRVELGEIEVTLKQHPQVSDAVVLPMQEGHAGNGLLAHVVSHEAELMQADSDAPSELVAYWHQVWEAIYTQPVPGHDLDNGQLGWRDSYTGQPIPADEMREWLDMTVDRILSWHPRNVLEIGCGTGAMLRRIAPHCSHYVATDISAAALRIAERAVASSGGGTGIELIERAADDFYGHRSQAFDTVILNSVVELFPGIGYLLNVLEKALDTVKPGGLIFIGDIRDLGLMRAFHASVQLHRAPASLSLAQLRQRIDDQLANEPQLLVDPAFFTALKSHFPRISHVQIMLHRGSAQNELTQFRYDALLHVEKAIDAEAAVERLDWQAGGLSIPALRQHLAERRPGLLAIEGIPNARLSRTAALVGLLAQGDDAADAGELRAALDRIDGKGVDPEALWTLLDDSGGDGGTGLPYRCYARSANGGDIDRFDVIYQRQDAGGATAVIQNVPDATPRKWTDYANDPLRSRRRRQLSAALRDYLAARLPDYMLPAKFIVMDAFPLTASGKIDRRALHAASRSRPDLATGFIGPQHAPENRIAAIWRELLQLDVVGIHDNFFELGGNSILLAQATVMLNVAFGTALSVLDLFQYPTIAALARQLGLAEGSSHADAGQAPAERSSSAREQLRERRERLRQVRQ
jgi:amino acid adenylation domain-containing protein